MRFWDASAVVPLLLEEDATDRVRAALLGDPAMLVWWGTRLECASAVARRERTGDLTPADASEALASLARLAAGWGELAPGEAVRSAAQRLVRVHPLRAADALQLAAAVVAAEHEPASLELVSLDDRLSDAARREGFTVIVP